MKEWFDKAFCINLDSRPERWAACQFDRLGIDVERVPGREIQVDGKHHGHAGCTAAHRDVLEKIVADSGWNHVLILEDDFHILYDDFQERVARMMPMVPENWDMLYFGGHYSKSPLRRINHNVIQCDGMFTTSSFGISADFAHRIYKTIQGVEPIDKLYSRHHVGNRVYILQPRLMIQRPGYSDILNEETNNLWVMTDSLHESMV